MQLKERECQIRQITRHESQPLFVRVFLLPLGNHINIRSIAYTSTTEKTWWTGLGPQSNILVPALSQWDSDLVSSSELIRVGTFSKEDHPLLISLHEWLPTHLLDLSEVTFLTAHCFPSPSKAHPTLGYTRVVRQYYISCLVDYGARSLVSDEGFFAAPPVQTSQKPSTAMWQRSPQWALRLVSHGGCHQAAWVRICLLPSQPGKAQLSETLGISPSNSSDLIWKKRKKLSSFFVADNTQRSTTVGAKGGL